DLGVAVLWSDPRNELRERGNFACPAQFDAAFGSFDLQRIAFLQLGFRNYGFGNAHGQAIAPLHHLRLHERRSSRIIYSVAQCIYIVDTRDGPSHERRTICSILSPPNALQIPAARFAISSLRSALPPSRRCVRRR